MSHLIVPLRCLVWSLFGVSLVTISGCAGDAHRTREIEPSTIAIAMPARFGELRRTIVEFPHSIHTIALKTDGCDECHSADLQGRWLFAFKCMEDLTDKDEWMNQYHDACISCHKERSQNELAAGPVVCVECHLKRAPGESGRVAISFDYSLHGRHSIAEQDKCETCHHVYNEEEKKLEYQKGKESNCRDCHTSELDQQDATPSLRTASHTNCINCHENRIKNGKKSGPIDCAGCHEQTRQDAIEKLATIPRIKRGQPNMTWVKTPGAQSNAVAFNHQMHESRSESCSTCHHETLNACSECHTLTGTPIGDGITLTEAFHDPRSTRSCVGCHQQSTVISDCAGCHRSIAEAPKEHSCTICHSGPRQIANADEMPAAMAEIPQLPALPKLSDDFPEMVIIDRLADEYGPSRLPHHRIVARLHEAIQTNTLAKRFHGTTQILCSGCHHETPMGTRPPPCSSCHGTTGNPTADKPSLQAAYHRQCIGCHQEMGHKTGCTDCHELASKEGQR